MYRHNLVLSIEPIEDRGKGVRCEIALVKTNLTKYFVVTETKLSETSRLTESVESNKSEQKRQPWSLIGR